MTMTPRMSVVQESAPELIANAVKLLRDAVNGNLAVKIHELGTGMVPTQFGQRLLDCAAALEGAAHPPVEQEPPETTMQRLDRLDADRLRKLERRWQECAGGVDASKAVLGSDSWTRLSDAIDNLPND